MLVPAFSVRSRWCMTSSIQASLRRRPKYPDCSRSVSRTVKNGSKTSSWGTTPSSRRARRYSAATSAPSTATRPPSGRASPAMTLISVVLPAPFGPSSPKNSPGLTCSDTPASARSAP